MLENEIRIKGTIFEKDGVPYFISLGMTVYLVPGPAVNHATTDSLLKVSISPILFNGKLTSQEENFISWHFEGLGCNQPEEEFG